MTGAGAAGPRLLEEDGTATGDDLARGMARVALPPQTSPPAEPDASPPQEPALLDLPEGMEAGPIDHGWAPAALTPRRPPPSPLNWIAGGLALLLLGWLVLSATAFVQDSFDRSATGGWITVAVFATALAAVLRGAWLETAAYRRLQGVDALRAALTRDDGPVEPARRLALDWLDRLPHLSEAAAARPTVAAAATILRPTRGAPHPSGGAVAPGHPPLR